MSVTASQNQTNFSLRRVIPMSDGFLYNEQAAKHYANIRRNDLVLVTRRIAPRPLPTRDHSRPYTTLVNDKREFVSQKKAHLLRSMAIIDPRPIDTRRMQYQSTGY
jgi:hypothetical protein